jgi:serine protease Do
MDKWSRILVSLSLLAILILSSCIQDQPYTPDRKPIPELTLPSFSEIVERVMPSVVYIVSEIDTGSSGQFLISRGSGVILRSDGYILTNKHVVDDAKRVEITLQDRRIFKASDIRICDVLDLAIVKIEANALPTAQFGDPETIMVGDLVIVLGHPLGFSPEDGGATVTMGIVSNQKRSFVIENTSYHDVIVTDAAISSGTSGGPMVNLRGEVIGITAVGTTGERVLGFAINIGTARIVFEDLIEYGESHHPFIGALLENVVPSFTQGTSTARRLGAVITEVVPEGPSDLAGLQPDDIIVRFNEVEIASVADLIRLLWRQEAGDRIRIEVWRGETKIETDVTLEQRPKTDINWIHFPL